MHSAPHVFRRNTSHMKTRPSLTLLLHPHSLSLSCSFLPFSPYLTFIPFLHPPFLPPFLSPLQYVYVWVSLLWTILISLTAPGYRNTITCTQRAVNLTCTHAHTLTHKQPYTILPVMKQCFEKKEKKKSFHWNTKEKSGHGAEEIREACQRYFYFLEQWFRGKRLPAEKISGCVFN